MANERLSKLQKWILDESYKLNVLHDESTVKNTAEPAWRRDIPYAFYEHWVYEFFYHIRNTRSAISHTDEYRKAHVAVCRSIRNMEEKRLIKVTRYLGYNRTHWTITEKGMNTLLCTPKYNPPTSSLHRRGVSSREGVPFPSPKHF